VRFGWLIRLLAFAVAGGASAVAHGAPTHWAALERGPHDPAAPRARDFVAPRTLVEKVVRQVGDSAYGLSTLITRHDETDLHREYQPIRLPGAGARALV